MTLSWNFRTRAKELYLYGVVRLTPNVMSLLLQRQLDMDDLQVTFQSQPMIRHCRFCTAVIAIDQCLCVLELSWHRLAFNSAIQVPKLRLHVGYAFTAYRTTIRSLRVF